MPELLQPKWLLKTKIWKLNTFFHSKKIKRGKIPIPQLPLSLGYLSREYGGGFNLFFPAWFVCQSSSFSSSIHWKEKLGKKPQSQSCNHNCTPWKSCTCSRILFQDCQLAYSPFSGKECLHAPLMLLSKYYSCYFGLECHKWMCQPTKQIGVMKQQLWKQHNWKTPFQEYSVTSCLLELHFDNK